MADKAITALNASGALTGAELLHVVQSGNSRKGTINEIPRPSNGFRGALVKKTADQTQNFQTGKQLTWDAEEYDTYGFHSTSSNNSRLTIPAGVTRVRLYGAVFMTGISTSADLFVYITKNGDSTWQGMAEQNSSTASGHSNVDIASLATGVITVSAGDYFELYTQAMGTDLSSTVEADHSYFAIEAMS
jgi:hypothetical protein